METTVNLEYHDHIIAKEIDDCLKRNIEKGLGKTGLGSVLGQEVMDSKERGELDSDIMEKYAGRNIAQEINDLKLDELSNEEKRIAISDFLDCRPDQISFTGQDALLGDIVYHCGGITIGSPKFKNIRFPLAVNGNIRLSLTEIPSGESLVLPQSVYTHIDLINLTSAKNLVLPQYIHGWIKLSSLESINDLDLSNVVEVATIYFSSALYANKDNYAKKLEKTIKKLEKAYPNLTGKFGGW